MSPTDDDAPSLTTRQNEGDEEHRTDVPNIDVQALAKEVYALLRRELVLERERRGWHRIW